MLRPGPRVVVAQWAKFSGTKKAQPAYRRRHGRG